MKTPYMQNQRWMKKYCLDNGIPNVVDTFLITIYIKGGYICKDIC